MPRGHPRLPVTSSIGWPPAYPETAKPQGPAFAATSRIVKGPFVLNRAIGASSRGFEPSAVPNFLGGATQLFNQTQDDWVVGADVWVEGLQAHLDVDLLRPHRHNEPARPILRTSEWLPVGSSPGLAPASRALRQPWRSVGP